MNDMMLEATRLTRANQLIEATVLIQRMLRGEINSEIARLGNRPPTIDGHAKTIDETKPPHFNAAPSAQPYYFRPLRDPKYCFKYPLRHGLQGWMGPAPLSTRDIVPEGGKFIEEIYTNPAGSIRCGQRRQGDLVHARACLCMRCGSVVVPKVHGHSPMLSGLAEWELDSRRFSAGDGVRPPPQRSRGFFGLVSLVTWGAQDPKASLVYSRAASTGRSDGQAQKGALLVRRDKHHHDTT